MIPQLPLIPSIQADQPTSAVAVSLLLDQYFEERESQVNAVHYDNIDLYNEKGELLTNQWLILEKPLGSGAFSDVYLAKCSLCADQFVAVKILKNFGKKQQAFERELRALVRTQESKWTINLKGFRAAPHCWLITEFMKQGSLAARLDNGEISTVLEAMDVGIQLAHAVHYLHGLDPPIMHRDITPENILFSDDCLRLADFGIAVELPTPVSSSYGEELQLSPNGNPLYRAPEVRKGSGYSLSAEVFNFGSILYEIFAGRKPFPADNAGICQVGKMPSLNAVAFAPIATVIDRCWAIDSKNRPSFKELSLELKQLWAAVLV